MEEAESELANRVNNLANLYVQAFYQYRFLASMLERADNMENSASYYRSRSEMAQRNAQVLLDYMHSHGIRFHLMLSPTLEAHFDARSVSEMDDHIRGALDDLKELAEQERQENQRGLSTLLASENAEDTPPPPLDIPLIAGENSDFRSETLSIEYQATPSTSSSTEGHRDSHDVHEDMPENENTETQEGTSDSNATPHETPAKKEGKDKKTGGGSTNGQHGKTAMPKNGSVDETNDTNETPSTSEMALRSGYEAPAKKEGKVKKTGGKKTAKRGQKSKKGKFNPFGEAKGRRKRGSTNGHQNGKTGMPKNDSAEETPDIDETPSTSGMVLRSGNVKSSEADAVGGVEPAAAETRRGKAKEKRNNRKKSTKAPRKKEGRSDSANNNRDLVPILHPIVAVQENDGIRVSVEQHGNETYIRCSVNVDIIIPKYE